MTTDNRNSRVIIVLMAAMTFGAALLLWLEPQTDRYRGDALLLAESGGRVAEVTIEYIAPGDVGQSQYDCLIDAEGEAGSLGAWSESARIAVLASGGDKLPVKQASTLMRLIGKLHQSHGLAMDQIRLAGTSDIRQTPTLPPQAADLVNLLVRKGIVQ
ncbi:hypothetical protein RAS1_25900 [Phycisphaerae bacterium RAS1]|nr:hypothetical protein RAS1_25900 [Phycisphaerae bacterium RAS1]